MNWMNAIYYLAGLALGIEIAYLVMKYRYDTVATKIDSMEDKLTDILESNGRIIDHWSETIDLNTKMLEELEQRD